MEKGKRKRPRNKKKKSENVRPSEIAADSPAYQPSKNLRTKDIFTSIDPNILLSNGKDQSDLNSEDYDYDEEGTIHPFGPDINPNKLLHTLTQQNEQKKLIENDFNSNPSSSINLTHSDGNNVAKALLPGPPRDLVAQIVNPRFVALSWLEPTVNPDEVISYTVYYKMINGNR